MQDLERLKEEEQGAISQAAKEHEVLAKELEDEKMRVGEYVAV